MASPNSKSSYSLRRVAEDLRSQKLAVDEIVREELAKIDSYSSFNAFVTTFDLDSEILSKNLARAKSVIEKQATKKGSVGSDLLGIPFTIKDNVFVAGYRTTVGCVAFKDFVPNVNGDVFDLFYSQGAIPLGKTNLHELALGPTGSASYLGPIRNAVDFTRVAGGSSGGSAVSVAKAKYAIATIGSDTGGSVRIPAALCGVCGLKPTIGAISSAGVFPLSVTLDTVGVLARTVDDLDFVLSNILPKRFAKDSSRSQRGKKKLRIGIPGKRYFDGASKSVLKDFWHAIDEIRQEFEIVEGISIPDEEKISRIRRSIMLREGAWFYAEVLANEEYRAKMDPDVLTPLDAGGKIGVVEAMQAEAFRQAFTSKMFGIFEEVNFVATPTCLIEAPKLEDMMDRSEYARQRPLLIRNPEVWNLCGFPALTLPSNRPDGVGLPTGFQLAGGYDNDRGVLDAGLAIWNLLHD